MIFHWDAGFFDKGAEFGFSFCVFEIWDGSKFVSEADPDLIYAFKMVNFNNFNIFKRVQESWASERMASFPFEIALRLIGV